LPFVQNEDLLSTGKQWEEWIEGIEREFRYFRITEPVDKRDALLIYGGKEIVRLNKSLKNERAEVDEYTVLKNKLDKYFLRRKNKHHVRYTFLRMKQERGEKIGSYVSRLREKGNDCEFGETMKETILEQCIQSVDNKELIRKAISKGWELVKFIEEAAQIEGTNLQMKEMKIEEHGAVYKVQHNTNRRQDYRQRPALGRNLQLSNAACSYCGFHHEGRGCPAYGKDCRSCGKKDHYAKKNYFASMCRTGSKQDNQQNKRGMIPSENRRNVRKTVENNLSEDSDQCDCSDEDDYFEGSIKHIAKI
jgi:hypothetical protein